MRIISILLLVLFLCVGCGMTPAQERAVNELHKNAKYFDKYVSPKVDKTDRSVIKANLQLAEKLNSPRGVE